MDLSGLNVRKKYLWKVCFISWCMFCRTEFQVVRLVLSTSYKMWVSAGNFTKKFCEKKECSCEGWIISPQNVKRKNERSDMQKGKDEAGKF